MLEELKQELEQLESLGRYKRFFPTLFKKQGLVEKRGKELVNFTSWDFLSLNQEKKFKRAAQVVIEESGMGAQAPRLSSGTSNIHLACENRIAKFVGTESALLFSSKNQALLTLVTSLITEQDVIIADELIHSPVADAAYLVNAQIRSYKSANLESLETELEKLQAFKKRFLFIEGLSPLSGKKANIDAIASLAKKYEVNLVIDESFSLGILGSRGAGIVELSKGKCEYLCQIGDLSTALCSYGAYIAASNIVSSYIINRSRTFQAEVPLPLAVAAATEAAIDLIELKPLEREKIIASAAKLKSGLEEIGISSLHDTDTPQICLHFEKLSLAQELAEALFEKGFLVDVLPLGALLQEGGVVRLIITRAHTEMHIKTLLQAFSEIYSKIKE